MANAKSKLIELLNRVAEDGDARAIRDLANYILELFPSQQERRAIVRGVLRAAQRQGSVIPDHLKEYAR